jgi:hypothetical protein
MNQQNNHPRISTNKQKTTMYENKTNLVSLKWGFLFLVSNQLQFRHSSIPMVFIKFLLPNGACL